MDARPRVIIIGGGISGLVAARNLQRDHNVTVFESTNQLGGKLATAYFRDRPLDLGADAFITRNPAAVELCTELGLGDHLIEPNTSGAAVYANHGLHPLPKGLVFGIPTDLRELHKSRTVGLWGVLRMMPDLVSLRSALPSDIAMAVKEGAYDPTVAETLRGRLGRRVVSRLIDPLVGGINASDVNQLSMYAALPQIAEQLRSTRSVVRRLRAMQQPPTTNTSSIFRGLSMGMAQLIDAIETELLKEGTAIYRSEAVQSITTSGNGFTITCAHRVLQAEQIILATPAYVSADLLAGLFPSLAQELAEIPYASVATVTFAWPKDAVDPSVSERLAPLVARSPHSATESASERVLPGNGVLIARDEGLMMSAATFTSTKWPRSSASGEVAIRASLGRHGDERAFSLTDEALIMQLRTELERLFKIDAVPLEVRVQRWPRSFPQYVRGHIARVQRIEQLSTSLGVGLAGAAYHGIGIPSCIDDANAVAEQIRVRSAVAQKS